MFDICIDIDGALVSNAFRGRTMRSFVTRASQPALKAVAAVAVFASVGLLAGQAPTAPAPSSPAGRGRAGIPAEGRGSGPDGGWGGRGNTSRRRRLPRRAHE